MELLACYLLGSLVIFIISILIKRKKISKRNGRTRHLYLFKLSMYSLFFGLLVPLAIITEGMIFEGFAHIGGISDDSSPPSEYEKSSEYGKDVLLICSIIVTPILLISGLIYFLT